MHIFCAEFGESNMHGRDDSATMNMNCSIYGET